MRAPKESRGSSSLADNSTIFLDEVGDLPLQLQVKLLRVIQEREVERVGGTRTLKLDFRVIAATNRDLKDMLSRGDFRQDLYYRLNIFVLKTPPLRRIREDIPRLAYHLLSTLDEIRPRLRRRIDAEAMRCLIAYDWPGNVREPAQRLGTSLVCSGRRFHFRGTPAHGNPGRRAYGFSRGGRFALSEG